jgi:hypothetical protein
MNALQNCLNQTKFAKAEANRRHETYFDGGGGEVFTGTNFRFCHSVGIFSILRFGHCVGIGSVFASGHFWNSIRYPLGNPSSCATRVQGFASEFKTGEEKAFFELICTLEPRTDAWEALFELTCVSSQFHVADPPDRRSPTRGAKLGIVRSAVCVLQFVNERLSCVMPPGASGVTGARAVDWQVAVTPVQRKNATILNRIALLRFRQDP